MLTYAPNETLILRPGPDDGATETVRPPWFPARTPETGPVLVRRGCDRRVWALGSGSMNLPSRPRRTVVSTQTASTESTGRSAITEHEIEQIERANAASGTPGRVHPRPLAPAEQLGQMGDGLRGGGLRRR